MVSSGSKKWTEKENLPDLVTTVETNVSVEVVGTGTVTGGRADGVTVTRNVVVSVNVMVLVRVTGTVTTDEADV